jgi:hypothetical protein
MWVEYFHSMPLVIRSETPYTIGREAHFPCKILKLKELFDSVDVTYRPVRWPDACFTSIVGVLIYATALLMVIADFGSWDTQENG